MLLPVWSHMDALFCLVKTDAWKYMKRGARKGTEVDHRRYKELKSVLPQASGSLYRNYKRKCVRIKQRPHYSK
jgi:hypothetical protein